MIFSVQISEEIIKLRKIGLLIGDLHIILKVLPNEIIKIYILPLRIPINKYVLVETYSSTWFGTLLLL